MMQLWVGRFGALCALTALVACSSSDDGGSNIGGGGDGGSSGMGAGGEGTGNTPGSGGAGTGGAGTGGAGAGSGGLSGSGGTGGLGSGGGGGSCPITMVDGGCAGELYVGETIPLDIYIMFDQSGTMGNIEEGGVTRLNAVRNAVGQFLQDDASIGLGVGIGYFGDFPLTDENMMPLPCTMTASCTSCDPADYTQPDVDIGTLPGNTQAIIDNLASKQPAGETPTGAAIRGACSYAKDYKMSHPGHELVILLVTDGIPQAPITCPDGMTGSCCPTLPDAVAAATDCLTGSPGIKTYVLGVGPSLDNLAQIATAGGTDMAYLVSGGDVSAQVLDALNAIRASAQVPCELQIPDPPSGTALNYNEVNIIRTSATCDVETLLYKTSVSECDPAGGGWYYDNPVAPTQINLCGKSCDDVSIPGSQLTFSLGCATIIR